MGTNYYLSKNVCPHCGRSDEQKHIGKSSAGWCFSLHVYPDENIHDLDDWKKLFAANDAKIKDEYDRDISAEELLLIITNRQWPIKDTPVGYESWADFHKQNHSEPGPNGLARHKVEQESGNQRQSFTNGCIAHGAGTWDCIVGEFS